MGWNHRILAHEHKGEIYLEIHEVYYDKDGKPTGYTKNGVTVGDEELKGIIWVLNKMVDATEKPILWAGDKFPQKYNQNEG